MFRCHPGAQGIGSIAEYVIHPIALMSISIYLSGTECHIHDHLACGNLWELSELV